MKDIHFLAHLYYVAPLSGYTFTLCIRVLREIFLGNSYLYQYTAIYFRFKNKYNLLIKRIVKIFVINDYHTRFTARKAFLIFPI